MQELLWKLNCLISYRPLPTTIMISKILRAYGISGTASRFGSGLIHHTWLVHSESGLFILQQVNHYIFKRPAIIAQNIRLIDRYLARHHPAYLLVAPLPTTEGSDQLYLPESGYYRLFSFVPQSHTTDVVQSPTQAFEAARQFGLFTKLLAGFDADTLQETLPHFHHLPLRYAQYNGALLNGNPERIRHAQPLCRRLQQYHPILSTSKALMAHPAFKRRVTHHDTKISNVLFNATGNGLCVVDLDTVMPGYFISDVGDMLRTYLSPVSEEEKEVTKINIRPAYFTAIANGYLDAMRDEMTAVEIDHFVFAGKYMTYMQALRFLTDYINNDVYYGEQYHEQNLIRAGNQLELLQQLTAMESELMRLLPR